MVQVLYLRYIGPLWPTKYWNSYNRNYNSAVQQLNLFNKYLLTTGDFWLFWDQR